MATDPRALWEGGPAEAWQPYEPGRDGAWDLARVAHLHRRAGFGASPSRLARDHDEGHEASIRRVLEGDPACPDGRSASEYDEIVQAMTGSLERNPSIVRARLLWIFRLLNSPHPLRERMTLAWHSHYASGARKVNDPLAMHEQNEAIRKLWDAPISRLHQAMLDSSALQIWLDGLDSEKGKPNENLGREFLELFSLGVGNYQEADVQAAARALTGYRVGERTTLRSQPVVYDAKRRDNGEKTLLGETGSWGPPDLVRIVSKQKAAARHVARRLYVTFITDVEPPAVELVDALADLIRDGDDVNVRRGIETVLHSRLFHAESVRGRKVKSPVDFVAGLVRTAGWYRPGIDPALIDVSLSRMGQTLFDPPSVAGWPGGLAWLGAPLLIARVNFVAEAAAKPGAEDHLRTLATREGSASPVAWREALAGSFLPDVPRADRFGDAAPSTYEEAIRTLVAVPEAHLA